MSILSDRLTRDNEVLRRNLESSLGGFRKKRQAPEGPGPDVWPRPEGMTAYRGYEFPKEPEPERDYGAMARSILGLPLKAASQALSLGVPGSASQRELGATLAESPLTQTIQNVPRVGREPLQPIVPSQREPARDTELARLLGESISPPPMTTEEAQNPLMAATFNPWIGAPARSLIGAVKPSLAYGKTATRAYAAPTLGKLATEEVGSVGRKVPKAEAQLFNANGGRIGSPLEVSASQLESGYFAQMLKNLLNEPHLKVVDGVVIPKIGIVRPVRTPKGNVKAWQLPGGRDLTTPQLIDEIAKLHAPVKPPKSEEDILKAAMNRMGPRKPKPSPKVAVPAAQAVKEPWMRRLLYAGQPLVPSRGNSDIPYDQFVEQVIKPAKALELAQTQRIEALLNNDLRALKKIAAAENVTLEQARKTGLHDKQALAYTIDHKRQVIKAVTEGKPVPPEVLADYPDLAAQAKPVVAPEAGPLSFEELFRRYQKESPKAAALVEDQLRNGQVDEAVRLLRRKGYDDRSTGVRRLTEYFKGGPSPAAPPAEAVAPRAAEESVKAARTRSRLLGRDEKLAQVRAELAAEPVPPKVAPQPVEPLAPPPPAAQAGAEVPPARPGAGGVPPGAGGVVPPAGPVTHATPPAPGAPGGVQRALDVAEAIVQRDKPGLLTRLQMIIPGVKQIRGGLQRALVMPEKTLKAWVAQGNVRGLVSQELAQERLPAMQRLSQMFGGGSISGEGKVTARFVGTTEQARYPWTNTLRDVLEYPELYDLSPEQKTFINALGEARDARFGAMKDAYGLKVGQFGRRPGAVFLSNYDVSESALDLYGTAERAGRIGRAKERFYEGARERWTHDVAVGKEFKPDTNVSRLLYNMDESLSGLAGKRVYTEGLGGRTKLQVMQETHPALAAKMEAFNKRLRTLAGRESRLEARQKQAIEDYLASPMEDEDIGLLRDGLEPALKRGPAQGQTLPEVQRELAGIRAQGEALRKSWRIANPKPYTRIQEGGNLYFKADEAEHIKRLAQTSNNPVINFVDNLRATAFGGDLSPATIQGLTAWFSDPVGVTKLAAGELKQAAKSRQLLRPFTEQGILDDIAKDAQGWRRFTEATGINPLQGPGAEFTTGFLGKIPKVGKGWEAFNEGIYRPLQKLSKDIFDSSFQAGIKRGLTEEQAMAVAADDATKMIPNWNPRRLGLSQAESARYRALLTSVSFLTQPTALTADAVKGLVKLGLRKPVTLSEGFAMKRVLTLVAATEALAVISNVKYAQDNGLDPTRAVLDSLNPDSGRFMSIVLPNGDRIGIGGPFRSLIRGIAPRSVSWSPVPVPFGGLAQFATSKEHPALRVVTDELRNEDFYGNKIRTGEFPMNVVQGLEYAFAQSAPLTVGTAAGELMAGKPPQEAAKQAAYQFAGTNVAALTPSQARNQAVQAESIKAGLPDVNSYYDLPGRERHAWDVSHPEVAANILTETKRRAENGDQSARYQLEKQRIYDEMVALETAVQAGNLNGEPYGRLQFKDDYRDRQLEMATARKTYEAIVKPTYKKAETQREKDVEAYYTLMDKFRLSAGKFDSEGWDKAETEFLAKLDQGQERELQDWLHANEPPLATEWREAKETLRPYWDLKDRVTARLQREYPQLNMQKALDDLALLRANPNQVNSKGKRYGDMAKWLAQQDHMQAWARTLRDQKELMRRKNKAVDEAGKKWYGWTPLKEKE